ncbi:MAG: NmrA/HSCARG family protein [bacterium]|jgi:uncharacterized protein YbjT (DUF2867 family)
MDKRTILVTGATGWQGGSVARFLLKDGKFSVRALTRKPDSETARELSKMGVEIFKGNLSDINLIRPAVKDCYGVFGVTNFWEHFDKEYEHGMNLLRAVKEAGVKHYVFSSLPHPKSFGYNNPVPHFEIKAQVEEAIRKEGIPATFIHVAFYYENFLFFVMPQKNGDGSFSYGFPQGDTLLAGTSAGDVGGVVTQIFNRPEEYMGRTVGVVGDDLKAADYIEIMSRHVGKKIVFNHIPREVFAKFEFPGAEDVANMFDMNRLHIPNRQKDIEESRRLYPGMKRFETWVMENKGKLEKVFSG